MIGYLIAFWPTLLLGAAVVAASLHPRKARRPRRIPRPVGRHAATRPRPGPRLVATELLATARTRPAPALPRATREQRRAADRATS